MVVRSSKPKALTGLNQTGQFGVSSSLFGDNSVSVHHYSRKDALTLEFLDTGIPVTPEFLTPWGQFGVRGTIRCQFIIIIASLASSR